jgi:hypothetical protein
MQILPKIDRFPRLQPLSHFLDEIVEAIVGGGGKFGGTVHGVKRLVFSFQFSDFA